MDHIDRWLWPMDDLLEPIRDKLLGWMHHDHVRHPKQKDLFEEWKAERARLWPMDDRPERIRDKLLGWMHHERTPILSSEEDIAWSDVPSYPLVPMSSDDLPSPEFEELAAAYPPAREGPVPEGYDDEDGVPGYPPVRLRDDRLPGLDLEELDAAYRAARERPGPVRYNHDGARTYRLDPASD